MTTKKETTTIILPELKLGTFQLKIVGDTPLICHAWSQKAKQEMLQKQLKKASAGKDIRRPVIDFADSLYWLTEKPKLDGLTDEQAKEILADIIPKSRFGFPLLAFKSSALDAGFQQGALVKNAGSSDLAKTTARGAIQVIDTLGNGLTEIFGTPSPREDMVRVGGASKTASFSYRAEFKSWHTVLTIRFNKNVISAEQIANLFRLGGFANGVGDWRPARNGNFGTFHIE